MVRKIGSRHSDGPISRLRFCGENVGRSFVVCSQDPISRTNKESLIWRQNDHRDIMQNLLAPFIFQEKCRMKIEHVLFPSVFFKITDPCVGRSFSMCLHDPTFGTNRNRILKLKMDLVNGPLKPCRFFLLGYIKLCRCPQ